MRWPFVITVVSTIFLPKRDAKRKHFKNKIYYKTIAHEGFLVKRWSLFRSEFGTGHGICTNLGTPTRKLAIKTMIDT